MRLAVQREAHAPCLISNYLGRTISNYLGRTPTMDRAERRRRGG